MTNITVMRLFSADLAAVEAQLQDQIAQAPSFFRGALLTVDLEAVKDNRPDLADLVRLLRNEGLVPAAVRGGGEELNKLAAGLNLGVLEWSEARAESPPEKPKPQTQSAASTMPTAIPNPPPVTQVKSSTLVITQLVRSGQQIYARGGDLIILNQVSSGAEVIADGHVHVYGRLSGRALAGAQGDESARVLCKQLEAELIAVAGVYRVSEQLDERLRGCAIQAFLREGSLMLQEM